jgi:hypothetical protein
VLLKGGRLTVGPRAAEVAGRVYRTLAEKNYFAARRDPSAKTFSGENCCSH